MPSKSGTETRQGDGSPLQDRLREKADRLERSPCGAATPLLREAADEIDRQRAEIADLKTRLGYPEFAR